MRAETPAPKELRRLLPPPRAPHGRSDSIVWAGGATGSMGRPESCGGWGAPRRAEPEAARPALVRRQPPRCGTPGRLAAQRPRPGGGDRSQSSSAAAPTFMSLMMAWKRPPSAPHSFSAVSMASRAQTQESARAQAAGEPRRCLPAPAQARRGARSPARNPKGRLASVSRRRRRLRPRRAPVTWRLGRLSAAPAQATRRRRREPPRSSSSSPQPSSASLLSRFRVERLPRGTRRASAPVAAEPVCYPSTAERAGGIRAGGGCAARSNREEEKEAPPQQQQQPGSRGGVIRGAAAGGGGRASHVGGASPQLEPPRRGGGVP